jgi:hypothetical protein
MSTIIRNFKNEPVKILLNQKQNHGYFNIVDAAKILNVNPFDFLDEDETKEEIRVYEESNIKNGLDKKVIILESSEEIFVHPLIIFRLAWFRNVDFYSWLFNTDKEITELLIFDKPYV